MNAYRTSAEDFHSLAIALLRAQQTRQWLLDVEKCHERSSRTLQSSAATCRLRIAGIAIAILAIILCSSMCFVQSTFGSIRGTVQDASGAAIPGAQVTLHSVDENTDQVASTDASGNY